jgi:DNA-binding transcriptional LysR family regulator
LTRTKDEESCRRAYIEVMARLVRSPELAELRAFCAAVDLGSIGRAARLMRVSQPALSKRLRTLETLAAAPLLERSTRGVKPTAAGARLYVEARRVVAEAENVETLMGGLGELDARPIRLATSPTIAEFVLPGPLVEFENLHERHLAVELFIANSHVVREFVRDGRADLGLAAIDAAARTDDALEEVPFFEDEIVVAVPKGHPWADAKQIKLADFASARMVTRDPDASARRIVDSMLADRGLSLAPPLAELGSTSAAKATALREGAPLLISHLALDEAGEALLIKRVAALRFERRFALLLASKESLMEDARALVDHLLRP